MPRVSETYNLQKMSPGVAKEWHPTENGTLTPKDVTPNSHQKVWWFCNKGHEWEARIYSRTRGSGCPFCAGKAVCNDNCLKTLNPFLSEQWHPTKNGTLTPKDVTPNSHQKVWWFCNKGHEWKARIYSRTRGGGCPYCSGQKVCDDNCLETVNTALAKEWHPTENGTLTPKDVTPNSHQKVWWFCNKGHEWKARIAHRSSGSGCPHCSKA